MCRWGTNKNIVIDGKTIKIDACLYDTIKYLLDNKVKTLASCCGHGNCEGSIMIDENDIDRAISLGYIAEFQEQENCFGELVRFGLIHVEPKYENIEYDEYVGVMLCKGCNRVKAGK